MIVQVRIYKARSPPVLYRKRIQTKFQKPLDEKSEILDWMNEKNRGFFCRLFKRTKINGRKTVKVFGGGNFIYLAEQVNSAENKNVSEGRLLIVVAREICIRLVHSRSWLTSQIELSTGFMFSVFYRPRGPRRSRPTPRDAYIRGVRTLRDEISRFLCPCNRRFVYLREFTRAGHAVVIDRTGLDPDNGRGGGQARFFFTSLMQMPSRTRFNGFGTVR